MLAVRLPACATQNNEVSLDEFKKISTLVTIEPPGLPSMVISLTLAVRIARLGSETEEEVQGITNATPSRQYRLNPFPTLIAPVLVAPPMPTLPMRALRALSPMCSDGDSVLYAVALTVHRKCIGLLMELGSMMDLG